MKKSSQKKEKSHFVATKKQRNELSRMNLLIFVGMPGSGKSEAANVAKKLGYNAFYFGDIVREEVRRRGLSINPENMKKISLWFHHGRTVIMVKRLIQKMKKIRTTKNFSILDGPRSPDELTYLKKHGFKCKVIFITVPKKIRYARQLSRGRADIITIKDAMDRDKRELNYGVAKMIAKATKKLSNAGSKAEFDKRIKKLLEFYEKKW